MTNRRDVPAHMLPRRHRLRSRAERAVFGAASGLAVVGVAALAVWAAPPTAVATVTPVRVQRVALPPSSSTTVSAPSPSTTAAPEASSSLQPPAPLLWPVRGTVTSEFADRAGRLHEGLDISAPQGTPIVAARAGRVSVVGRQGGYGNIVVINHGNRMSTAYPHQSAFATELGALVNAGDVIGFVGCTGSCTGPHLHFETRINGVPQNPRRFLPARALGRGDA